MAIKWQQEKVLSISKNDKKKIMMGIDLACLKNGEHNYYMTENRRMAS